MRVHQGPSRRQSSKLPRHKYQSGIGNKNTEWLPCGGESSLFGPGKSPLCPSLPQTEWRLCERSRSKPRRFPFPLFEARFAPTWRVTSLNERSLLVGLDVFDFSRLSTPYCAYDKTYLPQDSIACLRMYLIFAIADCLTYSDNDTFRA
jgi:hypothetical protein